MAYFFNRFFFVISTGTLMAVTVLVYIQDEVGRSWGYGICSASMFIALVIFFSGTKRYRYKKCSGSPVVHICQVVSAASGKKKAKLPSDISLLYEDLPEASRIHHTDQFRYAICDTKICQLFYCINQFNVISVLNCYHLLFLIL